MIVPPRPEAIDAHLVLAALPGDVGAGDVDEGVGVAGADGAGAGGCGLGG